MDKKKSNVKSEGRVVSGKEQMISSFTWMNDNGEIFDSRDKLPDNDKYFAPVANQHRRPKK